MGQVNTGWRAFLAGLVCWFLFGGYAATAVAQAPRLAYASVSLEGAGGGMLTVSTTSLPPAEPRRRGTVKPAEKASRIAPAVWRLSIDAGAIADSNVSNASSNSFFNFYDGDAVVPIELDPALRARSGTGANVVVSTGVKLRLSDGMAFAVDAEGQATDYRGGDNDDISFLLAAGPELTWSSEGSVSLQVVGAQSWYGGTSTQAGVGVRVRIQTLVAPGQRMFASLDARKFKSGFGEEFGGTQAGLTIGSSLVLGQSTSGSFGVYGRREWLGDDAYSSTEVGAYAGVSRYLPAGLTGSLYAGVGQTRYDAPIEYLSPDRRKDLRWSVGAQLTTRQPIGLGIFPTLSYSYNRTNGSIDLFDSKRHRVRIGVSREF